MITEIEVTLKITVSHPANALDENSVKGLINTTLDAVAGNHRILSTIADEPVNYAFANVVALKEDDEPKDLTKYGTDAVPFGRTNAERPGKKKRKA